MHSGPDDCIDLTSGLWPVRLTTLRENRNLDKKRRKARRFIRKNWRACSAALRSVVALRQRPAACEDSYLAADPDIPTSTAREAAARSLAAR